MLAMRIVCIGRSAATRTANPLSSSTVAPAQGVRQESGATSIRKPTGSSCSTSAGVPPADRDGDLVAAYYRLLQDPDPTMHMQAAKDWCAWESALVSVDPDAQPDPRRLQPAFQLAFARLVT